MKQFIKHSHHYLQHLGPQPQKHLLGPYCLFCTPLCICRWEDIWSHCSYSFCSGLRQPFLSPQLQILDSFSYAPEMSNIIDHVGRRRALGSSRSRTSSHPQSTKAVSLVQRDLLGPTSGLRRTQISMHDSRVRF